MNSERKVFIDAVASKNWIDKQSIEKDYKFSDGKFIAIKIDDIEYADWLNIGWDMWQASAQRQGYKLVPESEIDEAISAIKRSANVFYDNFGDWNEKEYLNSLADRLDKAMIGAVDE